MNFELLIFIFLCTGFLTGILAGMLGVGGGLIFVPVLYLLLPFTPIDRTQISYIVIGTSLFAAAITSISSGANHYFKKNVDARKAFYLAAGSILSSIVSSFLVIRIEPFWLKVIFAAVFILIAARMLAERDGKKNPNEKKSVVLKETYGILFGLAVGIFAAFTGLGGGILFVPILTYLFGVDFKKAIGTSSLVISVTGIAAAGAYAFHEPKGIVAPYQYGYVYLIAGLPLAIGAAAGAFRGVKIVLGSQTKSIKKVFSALLILVVIKILLGF